MTGHTERIRERTVSPSPSGLGRAARPGLGAALAAELTKIFTLRWALWTLLSALALNVGLGALVALSFRNALSGPPTEGTRNFDPLFAAFFSLTIGQLALVVFGVLTVGSEYSSGTIRAALAAVPRRGRFYLAKVLATALPVVVVAVGSAVVTFLTTQAVLGPYGVTPTAEGAPTAIIGAVVHLTLLSLFALGVAAMLRSSVRAMAVLLPVLFLGSMGLGNIPKVRTVTQFLPDQVGWVIMHLAGPPDDPRWARDYGPWTGLGILALWTAAALLGGYLVLRRRDA